MTEPTEPTAQPLSLASRIIGVITAPKATFQNIVASPRPFGVLFLMAAVVALVFALPQMTEKGQKASYDMSVRMTERFAGRTATPDELQKLDERSRSPLRFLNALGPFVAFPILALIWAALYWAAFNTVMGGTATFKQALAIVTHSTVISTLGAIAAVPFILIQGSMQIGGPFSLGALAPGGTSSFTSFLSLINVFTVWAFITDAIGLSVLYKRSSTNIALGLIAFYLLLAYLATAVARGFMPGGLS